MVDAERTVGDAFHATASRHADAIAIVDWRGTVTYSDLDRRTASVAAALGAIDRDERPVLVLTGHDAGAVVAMLGVARAGCRYLVLDPRAPRPSRAAIATRHGAGAIITDRAHAADATALLPEGTVIVLEDVEPAVAPAIQVDPAQVLAVSSTSGTSGRPKAVMHSHRNLVHNALRFAAAVDSVAGDRFLVALPFPFVAAGTPTFAALLSGATAVVHDPSRPGAGALADVVRTTGSTIVFLTAGLITSIAGRGALTPAPGVRLAVTGGDRLTVEQVRVVHGMFPAATLLHRYNTSETHWAAGLVIDPTALPEAGSVPIGWPVPWLDLDVREGELFVRGEHLALGYLDDAELTKERFAHVGQAREYRTRDLVFQNPDGMLEFVGRADATVKVHDVLVDPATVEAAIEACPGVRSAAVVPWRDEDGTTRLAAFAVASGVQARTIRRRLVDTLPIAMVPTTIDVVTELPLTAMGKVDGDHLAARAATRARAPYTEPQTPDEAWLAGQFAAILCLDGIGREDDFLALGGDSLSMVELQSVIEGRYGATVDISTLLENPTPAELAIVLRGPARPRCRDDSHLVRLASGSSGRTPVLLFAGAGGTAIEGLASLARHLDDRDCFAALPRAFEYVGHPDRTIDAIAASAVADWRRLRGADTVIAVGMSSGGNVAIEAARQLRAVGTPVELVVLLDSAPRSPQLTHGRRFGSAAARSISRGTSARSAQGRRTSTAHRALWVARLGAKRIRVRLRALTAGWPAVGGQRRRRAFYDLVTLALGRFEQADYEGDVLVVRATHPDPDHPWNQVPDLRWGDYVSGRLEVVTMTCRHADLVDPPFVTTTSAVIESALRRPAR